ncbi:MAG: TRAP transporter substrate-binding protein [Myxococcales bacterium]
MKRFAPLLAAAFVAAPLPARALVLVKLGTLAPQGSPYDQILEDMAHKWAEASGGTVKLRIYPGGVAGSEGDMVRKIGVGQLQAASLTTVGIHDITPEPQALDVPGLVRNPAELRYVLSHVRGEFDKALAAKGFVAITWADAGTVRFFSTFPMTSPAKTHQGKIWTWQGDPAAADSWQAIGFQPVVLSSTDIIPSLQTGMINVVPEPPLYAFVSHIFEKANHMLNLDWDLITGATVVKKETWDRIPPDIQTKLAAISEEAGRELSTKVQQMDQDSIGQMKSQGLVVDEPENPAGWHRLAEAAWPTIRGRVVPAALFDEVKRLAEEYRQSHGQ